jgi:hypothetical protein
MLGDLAHIGSQRNRRVEDARAIQVHRDAMGISHTLDCRHLLWTGHGAAMPIVRVLKANQSAARVVLIVGSNRGLNRLGSQDASLTIDQTRQQPSYGSHTALLAPVGVRLRLHDDFITTLAMTHQRDQVALTAAAHQQRGFLTRQLRGEILKAVDCRILAENVIADWSVAHCIAHCISR